MDGMTMECERAVELIEQLADGELTEDGIVTANKHLDGCAECRSHFEFIRALPENLNRHPDTPPAGYFERLPQTVMDRIRVEAPRVHDFAKSDKRDGPIGETQIGKKMIGKTKPARWTLWAIPVAASLVVFIVGRQVFDLGLGPQEPASSSEVAAGAEPRPATLEELDLETEPDVRDVPDVDDAPVAAFANDDSVVLPRSDRGPDTPAVPPPSPSAPTPGSPLRNEPSRAASTDLATPADTAEVSSASEPDQESSWVADERQPRRRFTSDQLEAQGQSLPNERTEAEDSVGDATESSAFSVLMSRTNRMGLTGRTVGEARRAGRSLWGSPAGSQALAELCTDWDDYLKRYPESKTREDGLYQRARCRLSLFRRSPSDANRLTALQAGREFLREGSDAVQLEEIRKGLDGIE